MDELDISYLTMAGPTLQSPVCTVLQKGPHSAISKLHPKPSMIKNRTTLNFEQRVDKKSDYT